MSILKKFGRKAPASFNIKKDALYDYSTQDYREDTVKFLLDYTIKERFGIDDYWKRMRSYYDGTHDTAKQIASLLGSIDIPWTPAQSPDGYIHVESQVDTAIPDFEFGGRGDEDSEKALQREKIVRYIIDKNNIEFKNSRNERNLGIYGTAVWKVIWDRNMNGIGNVCIDNPSPMSIYPDPHGASAEQCEYIAHTYRIHRSNAKRIFANDFKVKNMNDEDIKAVLSDSRNTANLFAFDDVSVFNTDTFDDSEQTVNIVEWWFKQPESGSAKIDYIDANGKLHEAAYDWKSGDIGLIILVNGVEARYIPKYWNITNHNFYPFIFYCKTPNENSIWGKSELEPVIPLIDAADRELAFAQLNSAFMSNDIIIAEENAFSDDSEPDNRPGAVWKLRPGMMGKVQRLGNIGYAESSLHGAADRFRKLIQETMGNFDTYQGAQPTRVTTATGIAMLNEQARARQEKKLVDRRHAFEKLYALCDCTALENYDDGRIIDIGAATERNQNSRFVYKFSNIVSEDNYIPDIDIKIHVGDGLKNSKAFSVSALSEIMRMPITEDNYELVKAFVKLIDIPQSLEICAFIDNKFKPQENPESAKANTNDNGNGNGTLPNIESIKDIDMNAMNAIANMYNMNGGGMPNISNTPNVPGETEVNNDGADVI